MVSDSELVGRLRDFLATSDLNTTTTATVRRRLEEDLEIDLSDRKAFIRDQIDLYLQSQTQEQENEDADGDERVKSEEQEEEEEEEEEGEEEEEEGSSKKRSKSKNNEVKKKRGGGGFCKLCSLSPELQKFVGAPEMARTEVVKQLWSYIREKDLQDPSNRRNIICDDTLGSLFRVKSINMFQMNKALTKHIWPLESENVSTKSPPPPKEKKQKKERDEDPAKSPPRKEKKQKKESDEDSDEPKRKEKRKGGGFLALIPISEPLANFIGTGETALSRSDAVKRIWDYIKQNNLQDPSDKRRILCDEKLRELFDVDDFIGFSVSKLLTSHFIKPEK